MTKMSGRGHVAVNLPTLNHRSIKNDTKQTNENRTKKLVVVLCNDESKDKKSLERQGQ